MAHGLLSDAGEDTCGEGVASMVMDFIGRRWRQVVSGAGAQAEAARSVAAFVAWLVRAQPARVSAHPMRIAMALGAAARFAMRRQGRWRAMYVGVPRARRGGRGCAWRECLAIACMAVTGAGPVWAAQYLEDGQGDLPHYFGTFDSIPPHIVLEPGSNVVAGNYKAYLSASNDDRDALKFVVPQGFMLDGIDMSFFAEGLILGVGSIDYPVERYRFELQAFDGTPPPSIGLLEVQALKPGPIFEPADNPIETPVFLPAGVYGLAWGGTTFTVRTGNAINNIDIAYSFDFKVVAAPVPLPPAAALLVLPLALLRTRRLRASAASISMARHALDDHPRKQT